MAARMTSTHTRSPPGRSMVSGCYEFESGRPSLPRGRARGPSGWRVLASSERHGARKIFRRIFCGNSRNFAPISSSAVHLIRQTPLRALYSLIHPPHFAVHFIFDLCSQSRIVSYGHTASYYERHICINKVEESARCETSWHIVPAQHDGSHYDRYAARLS